MSIAKTIARNTSFEFTNNIFELGILFVVGIALTRGLGTEQYGLYSYILWLIGLVMLGTNLGLGEMGRRFIPEAIGRKNTREVSGFIQLSFSIRFVAAIVLGALIILTSGHWASASGDEGNQLAFIIAAFYLVLHTIQQAFIGVFRGFQKFDYCFYINLITGPLRLLLIIIAMALGYDILTVLVINLITQFIGILFGVILLGKLISLRSLLLRALLSSDRRKQALRYSIITAGTLVLLYLLDSETEIFFIGLYHSVEDVGFFRLACTIGPLILAFTAALGYVLLPAIAEQYGKGDMEKVKNIYLVATRYITLFSIPMAVGAFALAGSIITQIYGAEYGPAILPLQIICLPIAIGKLAAPADSVLRAINRPGYIFFTSIILAVCNIGLSFLLIPPYGLTGAAIAISVSIGLTLPLRVIYVTKKIGVSWPVRDTMKIVTASLIMGTAVYFLNRQLGDTLPSLLIGIPLGMVLYLVAILTLRIIQEEDLALFRKLLTSLPPPLARLFLTLTAWLEKRITKKTPDTDK
jgi:O-antigen/teichoic acid export membrane protein